jgi:hypothetical protein
MWAKLEKSVDKSWHDLRALGASPIAKLSIFVPVAGYFILFNEKIFEYMSMSGVLIGVDAEAAKQIIDKDEQESSTFRQNMLISSVRQGWNLREVVETTWK